MSRCVVFDGSNFIHYDKEKGEYFLSKLDGCTVFTKEEACIFISELNDPHLTEKSIKTFPKVGYKLKIKK